MAQYAAFMQTEPVDPDDVYQSLAVRLIRAVNSYDPRKGYMEEYILSQLKRGGLVLVQAKNRAAMEAAWNDDARIEKMIYELNFGAFSKERLV